VDAIRNPPSEVTIRRDRKRRETCEALLVSRFAAAYASRGRRRVIWGIVRTPGRRVEAFKGSHQLQRRGGGALARTLPPDLASAERVDRLRHLRGLARAYSDVVLRLAKETTPTRRLKR
jgi:hypothetical protein